MNVQVNPHTITITVNNDINAGEYNVTQCSFEFSQEYNNLTKMAVFSTCDSTYKTSILNNQCTIPYEVLQNSGNVLLGVYGYEGDEELELRYSPKPQYFNVKNGSYKEGYDPELPEPSEWEQVLEQINQAIEETNNLDIDATKSGLTTTITITKKDGTEKEVEILSTSDIEALSSDIETTIKTDLDFDNTINGINHEIDDIKAEQITQNGAIKLNKDDIATINANLINYSLISETGSKIEFILDNTTYQMYARLKDKNNNVINTSNTIDLPIEQLVMSVEYDDTTKSIIITLQNGQQTVVPVGALISGLVSETQLQTTLQDYVQFTNYAKTSKAGVIVSGYYGLQVDSNNGKAYCDVYTYSNYGNIDNQRFISKGTLENVITGKGLIDNTVSTLTNYYDKTYIDNLVGNIESILETLDIGGGVE